MVRPLDLDQIRLGKGAHAPWIGDQLPRSGPPACLMEAVAYVAGEDWTDEPACASPVLGMYGRSLNDVLSDDRRQQLRPLIPRLIGTAGDGLDEQRGYLALDWLIRTWTPAWLDLAGLTTEAAELRQLRRIVDLVAAQQAAPVVRAARERAHAAGDAAWDAAAGAAAWAAAWAAAGAAAWDAAWAAAGAAAGAAARAAARDVLAPTVDQLQTSAIQLFTTMIRPDEETDVR
jgi:hypothetical protein